MQSGEGEEEEEEEEERGGGFGNGRQVGWGGGAGGLIWNSKVCGLDTQSFELAFRIVMVILKMVCNTPNN